MTALLRRIALAAACTAAACGSSPHAGPRDGGTDAGARDATPADGPTDAGSRGAYLVHETFDEMAISTAPSAPWATTGAVTVRPVPFADDHSAELAKPGAGDPAASLSVALAAASGRVVVDAKVLAAETAGFKAIPYLYDAQDTPLASIAFQDGNVIAHVGGTTTTVATFAANVWYRVRIVADTTTGTFDLYLDGVRVLHAAQLRNPGAAVARIAWFLDGTNTGTLDVDSVQVYTEAAFIGAPPSPRFDPRDYGATGDGTTDDTTALQRAVNAAAGTGGSVVLSGGTYLAGTVTLASHMTLFIDPSATLLGSTDPAAYPTQTPATGNTQLHNCQRALLYAPGVTDLVLDGGGTIDGQGDAAVWSGVEATRPLLVWAVLADRVTVRDLTLRKGAVWGLVSMETDHVDIDHVQVESAHITHDGIDIVDGSDVTVSDVAVSSGDDAMCVKSGVRRGVGTLTVRDSTFRGFSTSGGSNGIKLGTATYGAFAHLVFDHVVVKDVQYAAMAVESRQGADLSDIAFRHVVLSNTGAAFFVYLAQQDETAPAGDTPKLGSIDGVSFTDIAGTTSSWPNSPHQGSLITGHIYNGVTYPITNLSFTRVAVRFTGGRSSVPAAPPEAMPDQYPESNMFGDLPAWAYYLRHVQGVTFADCGTSAAAADARPALATDDVAQITGGP